MSRAAIAAALKAAFRPMFRGFEDDIAAIREETTQIAERVARIERKTGLDRAVDTLTGNKGIHGGARAGEEGAPRQ